MQRKMRTASTSRVIHAIAAIVCVMLGAAAYILFRSSTLLVFHWIDFVGQNDTVVGWREQFAPLGELMPSWCVDSLPFALWVLGYLHAMSAIWGGTLGVAKNAWFWCVPMIAICTEFGQITSLIPGQFDVVDLALIAAVTVGFYLLVIRLQHSPIINTTES